MTVAQTNVSLLKTTNRSLQLEVAQLKKYIIGLEEYQQKYPVSNLFNLLTTYESDFAEDIAKVDGLKDAVDAVIDLVNPNKQQQSSLQTVP